MEAAHADGRWAAAYAPPSEAEVPDDLLAAITAVPAARAMFDVLTKTNRFALAAGVWRRSPAGLAIACGNAALDAAFRAALPDLAPGDVAGSPYCVRDDVVDDELGGPAGSPWPARNWPGAACGWCWTTSRTTWHPTARPSPTTRSGSSAAPPRTTSARRRRGSGSTAT